MSREEMNWLLPRFEETGLIYHGSQAENLVSIFRNGLAHGHNGPADGHETIYNSHYRHRPRSIPRWVDPRMCTYGYMDRARQEARSALRRTIRSAAGRGQPVEVPTGPYVPI